MDELHKLGVLASIDDFGTGYSSLAHLKRFHPHKLKIDRSFVQDIAHDADDRTIIHAIISMASSLGMKTIAEGVETAEQLHILRESGCDYIQGYYFSPPLSAEQFEDFLAKNAPA
jgi:EAL domain-containing protein (putative c-di-GMP-specific phosphodiesterase class I)